MSERSPLLDGHRPREDANADATRKDDTRISTTRGTLIATAMFVLIFALTVNVSLLTTIQTSVATELNVTTEVSWFITAYLIALTAVTPVSGKLCQIFTTRVYLLASIAVQVVGLISCSLAQHLAGFLAGRIVCGIGAAAATPVSFILVNSLTSNHRRGLFFGLVNCGYTIGVACGAIFGGLLEPKVGWRGIFGLQAPIVLLAALTAFFAIPKNIEQEPELVEENESMWHKLTRIDYLGMVTLIFAVVLLLYGLAATQLEATPLVLSFLMLMLFVFVEVYWATEPVIPTAILSSGGVVLTVVATLGLMVARAGVLFYTPTYAIAVRGWSQTTAGLLLIPATVGFAIGGVVIGAVHIKHAKSYYVSTMIGIVLFSAVHFATSRLSTSDSPVWLYVCVLSANGFVIGATLNYSLVHMLYLIPPKDHLVAISFNMMFRSLSGSVGSSLMGGLFLRDLQESLQHGLPGKDSPRKQALIRELLSRPMLVQMLQGQAKVVAKDSYAHSTQQMFLVGSVIALLMLVFQASTGWRAPANRVDDRIEPPQSAADSEAPVREPIAN